MLPAERCRFKGLSASNAGKLNLLADELQILGTPVCRIIPEGNFLDNIYICHIEESMQAVEIRYLVMQHLVFNVLMAKNMYDLWTQNWSSYLALWKALKAANSMQIQRTIGRASCEKVVQVCSTFWKAIYKCTKLRKALLRVIGQPQTLRTFHSLVLHLLNAGWLFYM